MGIFFWGSFLLFLTVSFFFIIWLLWLPSIFQISSPSVSTLGTIPGPHNVWGCPVIFAPGTGPSTWHVVATIPLVPRPWKLLRGYTICVSGKAWTAIRYSNIDEVIQGFHVPVPNPTKTAVLRMCCRCISARMGSYSLLELISPFELVCTTFRTMNNIYTS